jgi:hypothetical protein
LFRVVQRRGPEDGELVRVSTIEDDLHAGGHAWSIERRTRCFRDRTC